MKPGSEKCEEWRRVFEVYDVSESGRVRRAVGGQGAIAGRELKWHMSGRGYPTVHIYRVKKKSLVSVHAIVAEVFVGPRPKSYEVNHKDGDKMNNHHTNLEYVTRGENMRHARDMNLLPHLSKLTREQADEMRALYDTDEFTYTSLGRMYGVSGATASRVVNGKIWTDGVQWGKT